jgi:hypothetical protein
MLSQQEMFEASFQRPKNYFKLSERRQWEIDEMLGILDWDGNNLSEADMKRFCAHYGIREPKDKKA